MKKALSVLMVMSVAVSCLAGEVWMTDFEAAKKVAAEKKLPILADFSGSDWCGWCIKLNKEVFDQEDFAKFASGKLVLFLADFPSKKKLPEAQAKQNDKLAAEFGIKGFPTVLILDAQGKVLAKTGYRAGGAAAYVEHIKSLLESGGKEGKQ
jgi:thioredoxin-related protein